jgi:hypothetical protein
MKILGYIWRSGFFDYELPEGIHLNYDDRSKDLIRNELLSIATRNIDSFLTDVENDKNALKPYSPDPIIRVERNRTLAFKEFISGMGSDFCVLVPSFDAIGSNVSNQLHSLLFARDKRILVATVNHTSLLKLDFDVAFELQDQLIISPMKQSVDLQASKAETNYIQLRDLMRKKATVDTIAKELGQSRMTIFRWRKQFEDRLTADVPGFKKGS